MIWEYVWHKNVFMIITCQLELTTFHLHDPREGQTSYGGP